MAKIMDAIRNFPKNAGYVADYAARRMAAKPGEYVESAQDKMADDDKKKRLAARDKALAERNRASRVRAEVNYQQDKAYGRLPERQQRARVAKAVHEAQTKAYGEYHYTPSDDENVKKESVVGRRGAHLLRRSD